MGIKEIMAAKKAAALASENTPSPEAAIIAAENTKKKEISPLEAMGLAEEISAGKATVETAIAASPPVEAIVPVKAMTFAERMAAKKAAASEVKVEIPLEDQPIDPPKTVPKIDRSSVKLTPAQEEVINEQDNTELAQAYSDLAIIINSLQYTDEGDSLKSAMDDLKKALRQNPAASMLVLDSDIGQMAMALRRLTGVALAETKESKQAAKKEAKAKKASVVPLSAEDIQAALEDM